MPIGWGYGTGGNLRTFSFVLGLGIAQAVWVLFVWFCTYKAMPFLLLPPPAFIVWWAMLI